MHRLIYVLACIAIPAVWGFVASSVYDRIEARFNPARASEKEDEESGEMYYI